MLSLSQIPKPRLTTAPTAEPLSLSEAKKQVDLPTSDSTHDSQIAMIIEQARQQWEHDTGEYFIQQTWEMKLPYLCEFSFPQRPVTSITSVQYYDTGNSTQTLSTDVYELDLSRSAIRLKYLKDWPATSDRWDAATITYVLGSHTVPSTVPAVAKQAMLLLVGYYFDANRGENDRPNDLAAYERLVAKYMRSSYP